MPSVLFRDLKEKLNSSFKNREFSGFMSEMSSSASEKSRKGFTFSNASVKSLKGFTLIELMIVIAIIGILVGVVLVAVDPVSLLNRANDSKKREELLQMKTTLQLYFNDNNDYPTAGNVVSDLVPDYTRSLPDEYIYMGPGVDNVPTGQYRAAVALEQPSSPNNDDNSYVKCGDAPRHPSGWGGTGGTYDYFICPD